MKNDLENKIEGTNNDTNQNLFTNDDSMNIKSGVKPLMKDKDKQLVPIKEEDKIV